MPKGFPDISRTSQLIALTENRYFNDSVGAPMNDSDSHFYNKNTNEHNNKHQNNKSLPHTSKSANTHNSPKKKARVMGGGLPHRSSLDDINENDEFKHEDTYAYTMSTHNMPLYEETETEPEIEYVNTNKNNNNNNNIRAPLGDMFDRGPRDSSQSTTIKVKKKKGPIKRMKTTPLPQQHTKKHSRQATLFDAVGGIAERLGKYAFFNILQKKTFAKKNLFLFCQF